MVFGTPNNVTLSLLWTLLLCIVCWCSCQKIIKYCYYCCCSKQPFCADVSL